MPVFKRLKFILEYTSDSHILGQPIILQKAIILIVNPFHATGRYLHSLKKLEVCFKRETGRDQCHEME